MSWSALHLYFSLSRSITITTFLGYVVLYCTVLAWYRSRITASVSYTRRKGLVIDTLGFGYLCTPLIFLSPDYT